MAKANAKDAMLRKRGRTRMQRREAMQGYLFILPWIIGFVFLFARPLATSIFYAFQKVSFTPSGIKTTFIGWENFIYKFRDDIYFQGRWFTPGVTSFLYEVPLVVIFSLFVAIILNQKFRGRTLARAMFFLPVIIASGVVIQILRGMGLDASMEAENAYVFNSGGLESMLIAMNFPPSIVNIFTQISNRIFDIVWMSGIQIILYLSGLQGIPASEYEAAQIEGATAWECFWKITWVRISPMTLVVVVYSIIDSFTNVSNKMIVFINSEYSGGNYGGSLGMGWLFCCIAFVVLGVSSAIISRYVFYVNDN